MKFSVENLVRNRMETKMYEHPHEHYAILTLIIYIVKKKKFKNVIKDFEFLKIIGLKELTHNIATFSN